MTGRGDEYTKEWSHTDFYAILERHRPDNCLAHRDAVFMVEKDEDIDLAGGATDHIIFLQPIGPVSRHDLNWSSEISCLISEGLHPDSQEVIAAANNYWSGVPHPNESVWEILASKARVLHAISYDSDQDADIIAEKLLLEISRSSDLNP